MRFLWVVFLAGQITVHAASVSWTNLFSATYTNNVNWLGGQPVAANDVFITNYITGSIVLTNRAAATTNASLTIYNDANTATYTLLLSNNVYQVTGATALGTNAIVQLGLGVAASSSTFSNGNLYLADNAQIVFNANRSIGGASTPNTLIVAGAFSNSAGTVIRSAPSGAAAVLQFAQAVTNNGLMSFQYGAGSSGETNLLLQASGFVNAGTVIAGITNTTTTTGTRHGVFQSPLINLGLFVLTNASTGASTTNFFTLTGGGLTNSGTVKVFSVLAGLRNVATLSGDVVNSGTLFGEATVANSTNLLVLPGGGSLSNAAGATVAAVNNGLFSIQAGNFVNLGTIAAANSATLQLIGPFSGDGTYRAEPGATLRLLGAGGPLDLANQVFYTGGTFMVQGPVTNTQAGPLIVPGSLIITNGKLVNSAYDDMILGADAGTTGMLILANSSLAVTNAGMARLIVGQNGWGTLALNGGSLIVNQLLVTNNVLFGPTNSIFTFTGGTLTTSNAADAIATRLINASNTAVNINGTWNMLGGSNIFASTFTGAGTLSIGFNTSYATVNVRNAVLDLSGMLQLTIANTSGNGITGNVLTVTDGAKVISRYFRINPGGPEGRSNKVVVAGPGSVISNFSTGVGCDISSRGQFNELIISNGGVFYSSWTLVGGSGGSNNTLLVTDTNSFFYQTVNSAAGFTLGGAGAVGNRLIVSNGAFVSIVGGSSLLSIGSNIGAHSNWVIVTGGGSTLTNGSTMEIGAGSSGDAYGNGLLITNGGHVRVSGQVTLGSGGPVTFASNAIIVAAGGKLTTVTGANYITGGHNLLLVDGGGLPATSTLVSNDGVTMVGAFNRFIVTNAFVNSTGPANLGSITGVGVTFSNLVSILDKGRWNLNAQLFTLGFGNATGHVVNVDGGVISNVGIVQIGTNGAVGNSLNIYNGGTFYSRALTVNGLDNSYNVGGIGAFSLVTNGLTTIGRSNGFNNTLTVTNAILRSAGLTVGGPDSTNNTARILAGGIFEANALITTNAGANNIITNFGGTYQFTTNTPVINPAGGAIALDSGAISYRAITNANVANPFTGLSLSGNNIFRLNAASNTTLISQTYTFDTAATYTRLELINGHTAYRGGNITIGSGGSMLISGTTATITGLFTNNGTLAIVNSTVIWSNTIANAGLFAGNGILRGNVNSSGTIAPGFSVGTLVFSNDLTLTGSYAAELDGTGTGTNDQLLVVGTLTLSGATLNVTELVGADDAAYIIATYGTLTGTFGTVTGLPSGYLLDYNYQSANQIAIVVPEPGSLALVVVGLLGLCLLQRHRRH